MNDTIALFSRLAALAAYFEGTDALWQAEPVFSPRAILTEGRAAAQTERIIPAQYDVQVAAPAGGVTPAEAANTLIKRLEAAQNGRIQTLFSQPGALTPRSGGWIPLSPAGGEDAAFFAEKTREGGAAEADAAALSRAFSRDARRYDE